MEKVYLLKGLDCPNCSAAIEDEVGKLPHVQSSHVNLMKQTLTITTDDTSEALTKAVESIVHRHEPDVPVIPQDGIARPIPMPGQCSCCADDDDDDDEGGNRRVLMLVVGAAIYIAAMVMIHGLSLEREWTLPVLLVAYVILGGALVKRAVKNLFHGQVFDEAFLMSLSTIGAFLIGEGQEGVVVMLFYQIGEFFQDKAVDRSRKSIQALMDIRPDIAHVKRNGALVTTVPEAVAVGETIVIKPGERVPLDGVVVDGMSMLDTSAITGESVPRQAKPGDTVISGCINQNSVLTVQTQKGYGDSTVAKIIDLVENASSRKAPTEKFITKFCRYYTPVVVIAAALLAIIPPLLFSGEWAEWVRRAFVFLVVSCPCALVISIPLTFFGGIGTASKKGVLVKGCNYLEALDNVKTIVFDKTGTLTKGVFTVTTVEPASGQSRESVLQYAARAEYFSNHPIAKSIRQACDTAIEENDLSQYEEIAGHGVALQYRGKQLLAGSHKLMDQFHIAYTSCNAVGTKVYVAWGGAYVGCVVIADEVKPDCADAIRRLRSLGITKLVMLTGDVTAIAKDVAHTLGLDGYYAELLPGEKVTKLEQLAQTKPAGSTIAFVGDGINDAPVLARADIGIAMGGAGSDAAIEAADVVLMSDSPDQLADAITVAKRTKRIVWQNIIIALGIKGIFLVLGAFGMAGMWEAVFGDVGVTMIAVLNSMRMIAKD